VHLQHALTLVAASITAIASAGMAMEATSVNSKIKRCVWVGMSGLAYLGRHVSRVA